MKNVAIFASGSGSNAKEIIHFFDDHAQIKISLIVTNKSDAGVLNIAKDAFIPFTIITEDDIYNSESLIVKLKERNIDLIVLAGFLWLMPMNILNAFPDKILNIHPSILPKYGGKGMYGHHVHKAVKANHEKETGITIHIVNEKYDEGNIIFQKKCRINDDMSSEDIANSVLKLEHKYYSRKIEEYINNIKA